MMNLYFLTFVSPVPGDRFNGCLVAAPDTNTAVLVAGSAWRGKISSEITAKMIGTVNEGTPIKLLCWVDTTLHAFGVIPS